MRTTLKTIADHVGLSVASVSLVLNNKPNKLSPESRQKILAAAEELHYAPQLVSPAMAKKYSKTLGLIVPEISNSFFADLAQGVGHCAQENGCQLLLSTTDGIAENDADILRLFSSRNIAAMLFVASSNCNASLLESLPFPIIQVDRKNPALNFSAVVFNQKKGGYLATRHLLELGHRRIACLTGPKNLTNTSLRLKGYLRAYKDLGVTPPSDGVIEGDYMSDSGFEAADVILERGFTAVFSTNDMMAYGILKRFRQLKIRVPHDISIVGFDDVVYSSLLDVPLTTIRQSGYNMGYEACRRAFEEIEDPKIMKQTIQFEPELIIRESTAKPANV